MELLKTQIHIGLDTPVRVLHTGDTHLTRADLRDGERKVALAEGRSKAFPHAEEVLAFAAKTSKELNLPILHAGDLVDFVSKANLEAAARFAEENDCFMAAGNHEFSLYVGEAWEDTAYRNQSLDAVQACHKNNIRMASRVIGEGKSAVNFIALDNGYYLFEPEQLAFLKQEAEKGLPMVLIMHVPLYDPALYEYSLTRSPACAYLTGVPEELMGFYEDYRFRQQKADEITLETMAYIADQPLIKAILTGHLHMNYEASYADRMPQLFTGDRAVRLIEFV